MPIDAATVRDTALDYAIRTLWALVVVVIAFVLARVARATTMRSLTRHRAHVNATVLLGNLAQVLVLVVGLLAVLAIYTQGAFGWILTSFSVIGIVVGLSLQDILKNFFAGIWVLVERPFRIGDTIQVGVNLGEVREISFRTTQLRTPDGLEVIVPNASLMTDAVVNLSRHPTRRSAIWLELPVALAGGIDEAVREALAATGAAEDPGPVVTLRSVSGGTARFQVTFWAKDQEAAIAAALAALQARFPQGEVHGA